MAEKELELAFSQGADDYLDDDVDGKGLKASNAQYIKNGEAKPYSALGHAWDEGFGYFGASREYHKFTDEEIAGEGGRKDWQGYHDTNDDKKIDWYKEMNHALSVNAAKRDLGSMGKTDFTKDAYVAFVEGRKLILAAGDKLTDDEMKKLKEYRNQISYLRKSVQMLNKNLQKDFDIHRKDNQRIMRENVELIKDVSRLRAAVKERQTDFNKAGGQKLLDAVKQKQEKLKESADADSGQGHHADPDDELEQVDGFDNSIARNLAVKKKYIQQLREQLSAMSRENQQLAARNGNNGLMADN